MYKQCVFRCLSTLSLCVGLTSLCNLNCNCFAFESSASQKRSAVILAAAVDSKKAKTGDRDDLSSEEILRKVASVYENCKTYKDSGISTTKITNADGSSSVFRRQFRTAFRRGNAFGKGGKYRFAYRLSLSERVYDKATILWSDGRNTMLCEDHPVRFKKQESLDMATARLAGVSGGTSHTIAALLMPDEVRGRRIVDMAVSKAPTRERLRDKACYRIEGKFDNDRVVLWIDTDILVIRGIEERRNYGGDLSVKRTDYIPIINERIPSILFEKQIENEWKGLEQHGTEQHESKADKE